MILYHIMYVFNTYYGEIVNPRKPLGINKQLRLKISCWILQIQNATYDKHVTLIHVFLY